jgi:hypothetical protein
MLRWNCKDPKQGCYYQKCCAKFNVFADCFPRGINFGDVDGIVEIGEKGLILEWKRVQVKLNTGPRLMYERLTKTQLLTVFVVSGNPETMVVDGLMIWFSGKTDGWKPSSLEAVKLRVKNWVQWAQKNEDARAENQGSRPNFVQQPQHKIRLDTIE